ncbi:hypothetical protein [Paracidovorax anthurii]|uniref:Uncharacterized protein n=1 Tax=Paracidovorax anthurii TaxID=78229 RepID=A0A328YR36_9BURK|nr:hypothetical protein [Paracidovorax anthurii]RAR76468.1 hypothetical protein AX018_104711 [Paracidovorax anthurii]
MAAQPPKTPPRFVPTLTDVVQVADGRPPVVGQPPWRGASGAAVAPAAPRPEPERPVPRQPVVPAPAVAAEPKAAMPDLAGIEEVVIHRIIQRVDVVLDQRLREAIATVVQEQTRSMVPRLREEVEAVVRHAVYEAVAEELGMQPGADAR